MANKDNLIKLVAQKLGPDKLKQMVDQVEQTVGADPDVNAQSIDTIIQQFEFVAEHPDQYKDVLAKAIQSGVIDANTLPPEFDPVMIAVMLLAFYGLRERLQQRGQQQQPMMSHGGLSSVAKHLQSQGRGGDTILAHINPMEAEALKRMGGSGTVNPHTGLREFKGGLLGGVVKIVKAVAPIAISFIPGIGPRAGAAIGAGLGAIGGGGIKGALIGGIGGALGTSAGQGVAKSIGTGLSSFVPESLSGILTPQVLGSGVLGGATTALAGGNPITGALTAGLTSYAAPKLATMLGDSMPSLAQYGNAAAKGATISTQLGGSPVTGAIAGGLGQVANNVFNPAPNAGINLTQGANGEIAPIGGPGVQLGQYSPSGAAVNDAGGIDYSTGTRIPTAGVAATDPYQVAAAAPVGGLGQAATTPTSTSPATSMSISDMAKLAAVGALLGGKTPTQATQAIQDAELTQQQKDAMLRTLTNYKFEPNITTFPAQGTPGYDALMNELRQGIMQTYTKPTFTEIPAKARGGKMARPQGALSQVSRLAQGAGTGRSDSIDAKLSDGEYVIDAETVALLGNGSTKAGAAMLDQMRQGIRQQKGKALAKGNFSPDAKSPLAYMKGGLK